jgi:hypothetical protein
MEERPPRFYCASHENDQIICRHSRRPAARMVRRPRAVLYEYKFIFSGTAYETNASGKLVGTPITGQTLLQVLAQRGNITDLSTISIVYHINGNPLGDTVDVISNANGQVLVNELGLFSARIAAWDEPP